MRTRALGCDVDPLTLDAAVACVIDWLTELQTCRSSTPTLLPKCKFVVTPNLDHAVMLRKNEKLRLAYDDAALVLADGMPLVWAARIFRRHLPERVTGSDLTPGVLGSAPQGTKVFFLGASDAASQTAVENARRIYPNIEIVGRISPPFGFETSAEWSDQITSQISESKATLILVGLGAPKQEIWVLEHQHLLPGTVALCVGAAIDFLAGSVTRAPRWAQAWGLEWAHRLFSEPRRLAKRYGRDAAHLPYLLIQDAFYREKTTNSQSLNR